MLHNILITSRPAHRVDGYKSYLCQQNYFMLLSMTSYGRVAAPLRDKSIVVELKTLNSKFVDLRLRLPANFYEKEMWIRKYIHDKLLRGKVEATFTYQNEEGGEVYKINRTLFKDYHNQLRTITDELKMQDGDLLSAILKLPEVVSTPEDPLSDEDWEVVKTCLSNALDKIIAHRKAEGESIKAALTQHIENIQSHLEQVNPFETQRVERIRNRMSNNMEEYMQKENIDENRFEQEVLFYLEKIDISEEKVRLAQHCDYFLQEMALEHPSKGKKLNFISQEIGREINTLGAKAYSSDIQRLVVLMKDELEKIKEQVANVL